KAARLCSSHHFTTKELGWIWNVIKDVWDRNRELVHPRVFLRRLRDEFPEKEKQKPYSMLVVSLYKRKPKSPKTALEELDLFVRNVQLHLALEKAVDALEKGKIADAEKSIQKASSHNFGQKIYTHVKWIEEFEGRQKTRKHEREHPEEFTVIPTGIKRLDKILAGGSREGEIGLVMGTTGSGKSILTTNFGFAGAKAKFNVVIFPMEMPAHQVATRLDALWSGFRYDQFKAYDFKPSELRAIESRLEKAKKRFKNRIQIVSMPVRSADIMSIRNALEDLKEEHEFIPDLIIMDSGDHLRSADKTLDQFRLQQAEVYWNLKQLAEEDGYVIWSTVHAGREWADKIATAEATAESYDKARIADLVISINDPNDRPSFKKKTIVEDDSEEEDEEVEIKGSGTFDGSRYLELYLAKYRDGASKVKIPLQADFSRMIMKEIEREEEEEKED